MGAEINNRIVSKLGKGNNKEFWKCWKSEFGKANLSIASIDGCISSTEICNKFGCVFQEANIVSSDYVNAYDKCVIKFAYSVFDFSNTDLLSLDEIVNLTNDLNASEALDYNGICINHLKFLDFSLLNILIELLCKYLLMGYVLSGFGLGKVIL